MRTATLRFMFVLLTLTGISCLRAESRLVSRTPKLLKVAPARKVPYKAVTDKTGKKTKLMLHIFEPVNRNKKEKLPVIVFFFGGGWVGGSAGQFYAQCDYLAARNMVAISADYRTARKHGTTPFDCVEDGKSAVRYIRIHAKELGIDPNRVIAGGGSAGGHVAACTGVIKGFEAKGENLKISSVPNAMVLMNPVIDTTKKGYGATNVKGRETEISPCHHVRAGIVPTIIFHGTADTTVPFENVKRFTKLMKEKGNICELHPFRDRKHGFFNSKRFRRNLDGKDFKAIMQLTVEFLKKQGLIDKKTPK